MNRLLRTIGYHKENYLCLAFSALVLFFFASFINRAIYIDDAWLGEQAYWLKKVGHVKSELLRGFIGFEDKQLVYHKLFIWLGALFIAVFGFNLYVLKSISVLFLIIFLILLYRYTKEYLGLSKSIRLLLLVLVLINPLIFYFGFVFRPEIMLMTLGFTTYIFLEMANRNNKILYAVLAGVFAGLALLTHLNGLSIAISGFLVLVLFRRYRLSISYAIAGIITGSIYFIDLHSLSDFKTFAYHFNSDPALTNNDYSGVWSYVFNLLSEHKRFFRDLKTFPFTLAVISILLIGSKGLKQHAFLKIFSILLILIFAALSQSKTTKYMIIYLPYVWLIVGLCLQYILKEREYRFKHGIIVVLVIYCIFNVAFNFVSFSENKNYVSLHQKISKQHNLENQKMVGPMPFIFDQIGHQTIQSVRVYKFLKERGEYLENGSFDFFRTAELFGNTSIVLNPESFALLEIPIPEAKGKFGHYELVEIKENEYYIYKLNIRKD